MFNAKTPGALTCSTPERASTTRPRFSELSTIDVTAIRTETPKKRRQRRAPSEESQSSSASTSSNRAVVAGRISHVFSRLSLDSEDRQEAEKTVKKRKIAKALPDADWKHFKPENETNLFAVVVKINEDLKVVAERMVRYYNTDSEGSRMVIVQFLLDVTGYHNLDCYNILDLNKHNYNELKIHMDEERNVPEIHEDGKYLLKSSTAWGQRCQECIYEFYDHFLRQCEKSEVLFADTFLKMLIPTLISFINCHRRAALFTGVVFGSKTVTVLLELHRNMQTQLDDMEASKASLTASERKTLDILAGYEGKLSQAIQFLLKAIKSKCAIEDGSLGKMKIEFLEEFHKWLLIEPELLDQIYLNRLLSLVEDMKPNVRLAALHLFQWVISDQLLFSTLKSSLKKIMIIISDRSNDVSIAVAVAAIDICTQVIQLDRDKCLIPQFTMKKMAILVYHSKQQLALAAGKFLVTYIRSYMNENNETTFLEKLAIFHRTSSLAPERTPLLVEAVILPYPEIYNWKMITDRICSLGNDEDSVLMANILYDIFCCAAHQIFMGESKIIRGKPIVPKTPIDTADDTDILLKCIARLFKRNGCMKLSAVTEVLLFIDYNLVMRNKQDFKIILKRINEEFVRSNDEKVLENISKLYAKISECTSPCKNAMEPFLAHIKNDVAEAFSEFVTNLYEITVAEDAMELFEDMSLRLSILYEHHDLTELIGVDILHKCSRFDEKQFLKCQASIIKCRCSLVIWKCMRVIEDLKGSPKDLTEDEISSFHSILKPFIDTCWKYLNEETANVRFAALEAFSKFYTTCTDAVEELQVIPSVKYLIPALSQDVIRRFMDAVIRVLFQHKDQPWKRRYSLLRNVVDLTAIQVIPIMELKNIFKYYFKELSDYGVLIKRCIQHIREKGYEFVAMLIFATVRDCFMNVQKDQIERDNLRFLAKHFEDIITTEEAILILRLSIKVMTSSAADFEIFDYVKYFLKKLSAEEREEILDFLHSKLSVNLIRSPRLAEFMAYMRSIKKRGLKAVSVNAESDSTAVSQRSGEAVIEETTLSEVEGYTIDEDSEVEINDVASSASA